MAARRFSRARAERQTLRCIRCAACMNACPVYRQTGGHAYGSVYPGPIGAILTPQLDAAEARAVAARFASSLCGACYEVCPVKINIPEILIDLRAQVTDQERGKAARFLDPMYLGMRVANLMFSRAWLVSRGAMDGADRAAGCSRAKTDGFTRCPAWARSGRRRAICAACRSRRFTSGGKHKKGGVAMNLTLGCACGILKRTQVEPRSKLGRNADREYAGARDYIRARLARH